MTGQTTPDPGSERERPVSACSGELASRELGTTPGPWHYDEQLYIWGPDTEMVADVEHWPDDEREIGRTRGYGGGLPQDRNARLLAAAPELYDALASLLDECPCDPDINPEWLAAWESARDLRARLQREAG